MRLNSLNIVNFKNYAEVNIEFPSKINVLVGLNGSGKTNLLDSIYYLSITKSAFQADQYIIRHGQNHFFIKGHFEIDGKRHEVTAGMQQGSRKAIRENGQEYQKLSDHIGKYPVVMITPDDVSLIREGSEVRRRFIDSILSQIDHAYLENLLQYNHALKQRNSLLSMFNESGKTDWLALESYDSILISRGVAVFNRRKLFLERFTQVFCKHFDMLVDGVEQSSIEYLSGLDRQTNGSAETIFSEGLMKSRQKDVATQRTSFGIHRDDFLFSINQGDLRRIGSQGQQKSFAIALKLAQWELMREAKDFKPLILLDDIFDKLDDQRISRLLELIRTEFGQLFVTDARPDRTQALFKDHQSVTSFFEVRNGEIKKLYESE